MKIVPLILNKFPEEKKWWGDCERKEEIAKRNEILDIVFYKGKESYANILGRFENFYHPRRVIGKYVPWLSFILSFFICTFSNVSIISPRFLDFSFCFHHHFLFLILILHYLPYYVFILILIMIISYMVIKPTWGDEFLKREIEELETNVILQRKYEILEIIRERHDMDSSNFHSE